MGRARAAVVLAAVLGLVWMHALVAPASVDAASAVSTQMASAPAEHPDGHPAPSGGGHDEGLGTAHLCLAVLAAGAVVLLVARAVLRGTRPYAGRTDAPVPITRRATWNLPPPDLVSALSISRT